MMYKKLLLLLAAVLLTGGIAPCAHARAEALGDFCGVWVSEGVAVEIWRADDAGNAGCRAVFSDGRDDSDVWTYNACWVDASDASLQCAGVVRSHKHFDGTWETLEETDWSASDLDYARLERTDSGLRFSGDGLDAPIDLAPLDAAAGERGAALAFVGFWKSAYATLRVEDCGAAYLFTVAAPVDADSDCEWTYTCRYDAAAGHMASVEVSPRRIITRTAEGGTIEEEVGYDASEAVFYFDEAEGLVWSDVTDGDGEDMAFTRAGRP